MHDLDRREFFKKSAKLTAVTAVCLCGLEGCATYTKLGSTPAANPESLAFADNTITVDLTKEPNLSRVGGAVKIIRSEIPQGMIIAHVERDRFEVVSLLCPHRGVEVEYDHQRTRFQCASIGSSLFAIDGNNISGPANSPLRDYDAVLDNGILTVRA